MNTHVLLVENSEGEWVGVPFPSINAARQWQDDILGEDDDSVRGVVPIWSKQDVLDDFDTLNIK